MPEDNNMMETMEITTSQEENTEESGGLPIGLILAGAFAGGVAVYKGVTWIGRKLFKKKSYAEPVRLVKDKK